MIKRISFLVLSFSFFAITQIFGQTLDKKLKKIAADYESQINALKDSIETISHKAVGHALGIGEQSNIQITKFLLNEQIRKLSNAEQLKFREAELQYLLAIDTGVGKNMVTNTDYNNIIKSRFQTLSGTEIKNGKFYGSSVTVDSKSVTVNGSIKLSRAHEVYLQPNISGTSANGFTTVFTGDKYSKTITGGLNLIFLDGNNRSRYNDNDANKLHNDLKVLTYNYDTKERDKQIKFYNDNFTKLDSILNSDQDPTGIPDSIAFIDKYLSGNLKSDSITAKSLKVLTDYKKTVDTLTKSKLLPENFDKLPLRYRQRLVKTRKEDDIPNLVLSNYLDGADKLQQKATFRSEAIHWYSGGLKYNVANYNIADSTSKKFITNFPDNYFSFNFSWTWMKLYASGSHLYVSPTYNIQNPHNFVAKNQLHAEIFKPYSIGSTQTQEVSQDLTFYPTKPGRLITNYLLLPVAYYNTNWGVGVEMDLKYGRNDVNDDNESVSLGILIPIQGDKSAVVIEPIFKAQKLNEKITSFWANNASVGVSVTVAIPKGFFDKDK